MLTPKALPSGKAMQLLLSDSEDVLQVAKQELNILSREPRLRLFLRYVFICTEQGCFPASWCSLIVQGFSLTAEEMSGKEN